mgnify:CR=1 FL=1
MSIKAKYFNELTTTELYELLKVRSEIFVVEQNCLYQDLDDIDYNSLHIFIEKKNEIVAYLRAFYKDNSKDVVQVGRVLTKKHGIGTGKRLMVESLPIIKEKLKPKKIYIEAQKYAEDFYKKFGFITKSKEFLEDGIYHVIMELDICLFN